jgi:solute carrier family 25 protein 33/36
VREEGIKGLYRGLSASLVGLSESTFQFVMYEYFKSSAIEVKQKQSQLTGIAVPDGGLSI